jgi:hypothetical protein
MPSSGRSGGRTWWAHLELTRINITPTILRKKIEDVREGRLEICGASSHECATVITTFPFLCPCSTCSKASAIPSKG